VAVFTVPTIGDHRVQNDYLRHNRNDYITDGKWYQFGERNELMQWNLLTTTLTANALFSGLSGMLLTIAAAPMAHWLGIPIWICFAVGGGLVLFSVQVAMTARNPQPTAVRMVIIADAVWVVSASALIAVFPESMSDQGLVALGIVTIGVAVFAVLQWIGLRHVMHKPVRTAVSLP